MVGEDKRRDVLLMTRSAREAREPAGVVALTQYSSASSPNTSLTISVYVSPSFDIENLSLSASSLAPLYLHRTCPVTPGRPYHMSMSMSINYF